MEKEDKINPGIEGASELSPLQLNGIKLDAKHTVLTPKKLEEMAE